MKVSPACQHCYAETWAKRLGQKVWGSASDRRFFGEKHWKEPLRWNRDAEQEGVRSRVFCASMADVFEDREDLKLWREKLWKLIKETPHLDWLLLTKRPENISSMIDWKKWPSNIWLGATVENQEMADERLTHLLKHKATVRFLSCEPLLGDLKLKKWAKKRGMQKIDWIIAGGESGPKSRPMNPQSLRDLRDFCVENEIAFHFKQWGNWGPAPDGTTRKTVEFDGEVMAHLGKAVSGRTLDDGEWDQLPKILANV